MTHSEIGKMICALAVLLGLSAMPAAAYSNSPATTPLPAQNENQSLAGSDDRIIIPAAPERENDQGYQNLEIHRDLTLLPETVKRMRDELLAAAKSGNVEALRPIVKRQTNMPVLSFGAVLDPILFLRDSSNDGEGRELMAIMIELLEAPYAVSPAENGEPEIYVWPAYASNDLENLSPQELIDVYKIVSHQDLEEMQLYGGWYFFRVASMPMVNGAIS